MHLVRGDHHGSATIAVASTLCTQLLDFHRRIYELVAIMMFIASALSVSFRVGIMGLLRLLATSIYSVNAPDHHV